MTDKIKTALAQWAQMVLDNQVEWDAKTTHDAIQKLYELSIYQKMLLKDHSPTDQWSRHQAEIQTVIETLTGDSTQKTEHSSKDEESLEVPPMMEAIKDLVTEMPENTSYESLFDTVSEMPTFVPKEEQEEKKEEVPKVEFVADVLEERKNINDHFAKSLTIDLNDRLAFVKHLFDQDVQSYEKVIRQVVTFQKWEEVQNFIQNWVKPEYQNWKDKEAVEERFLSILQKNFTD